MYRTQIMIYFLINLILFVQSSFAVSVDELLEKGTRELSQGKFQEAISLYSEAINLDPKNYLSFYRRATAYLALGKVKTSVGDLEAVLELNPSHHPTRKQLGNSLIKLGNLVEARTHFVQLNDDEAKEKVNKVDNLIDNFEDVKNSHLTRECKANLAKLNDLVDEMPLFEELRKTRAECFFQLGEFNRGIQDMRQSVHLVNDNRKGLLDLSILMYNYGLAIQAIEEVRQCLKLDQDDKDCHKHYKKLKKLIKSITNAEESIEKNSWTDCVKYSKQIIELEPEKDSYINQANIHLCKCYSKIGSKDAIDVCNNIIEKNPDNTDYRLHLAEAYLANDEYDPAIVEYQKILEYDRNNNQAKEGMEKAQRMKKQANSRNYYKILGVPRNAQKKEIMKAYRKLAAEWHPDRFSEKDKKNAEKKFIDITDAKEVLTDEEKRAQFDRGIDPLDPQAQSGGGGGGHPFRGGHPFAQNFHFQGFNPFEDGNFEFHFG